MRKLLIIGKHKTSFAMRLAKLVSLLGQKCAIIDATNTDEFGVVTEAKTAEVMPYYWADVIIGKTYSDLSDEDVDVCLTIADRGEDVDLSDYEDALIVTDYLLRDARILSETFTDLFTDHRRGEKNGKGKPKVKTAKKPKKKKGEVSAAEAEDEQSSEIAEEGVVTAKTHLSVIVVDYVEVRYTTRAILHKLGIIIPDEDVLVVSRNMADMKADVGLDLGNKINFKKLSKEYRTALGGAYRMCNPDVTSESLRKVLGMKGL